MQEQVPLSVAPSDWPTRRDAAARLGISVSSVRRMEFDSLHPIADERGVWHFDPAELEALASTRARVATRTHPRHDAPLRTEARARVREGRTAARVFQMFARSWSLPQIVVATKEPPDHIRVLYHEWSTSLEEREWQRVDR